MWPLLKFYENRSRHCGCWTFGLQRLRSSRRPSNLTMKTLNRTVKWKSLQVWTRLQRCVTCVHLAVPLAAQSPQCAWPVDHSSAFAIRNWFEFWKKKNRWTNHRWPCRVAAVLNFLLFTFSLSNMPLVLGELLLSLLFSIFSSSNFYGFCAMSQWSEQSENQNEMKKIARIEWSFDVYCEKYWLLTWRVRELERIFIETVMMWSNNHK